MTTKLSENRAINCLVKKPLIASDYIEGKGDLIVRLEKSNYNLCPTSLNVEEINSDTSRIIKGSKGKKCPLKKDISSSSIVNKLNEIEINFYHTLTELRADLSVLDSYLNDLEVDDKTKAIWLPLCEWIADFSFSLGRYVALKGKTKHKAPLQDVNEMVRVIEHCKELTGNCDNFLYHREKDISLVNKVLIKTRKLESHYEFWVISNKDKLKDINGACDWQLLLNRLSSMIFWMLRHKYQQDCKKEFQWSGNVKKLNIDL